MDFLQVSDLSKQTPGFQLIDITFTQRKFQRIAIAGETGSGKSTLLKIIAGLIQPDQGEVIFKGEKVKGPDETLVPGHSSIAYLSQDYDLAKFLTVEQVLSYANVLSDESAQIVFEVCRISHLLCRKTDQLSGGERQRIAIARLLVSAPDLLLLDEPYSNLDVAYKRILQDVIRDIGRKLKISCILVSHDPADTLSWASKILVMRAGKIIQKGPPEKIYRQPVDEYTAALFGRYNLFTYDSFPQLYDLFKIKERNRKLLVRPEHFHIVPRNSKAFPAIVKNVHFYGNCYEVEVVLPSDTHTTIQVAENKFAKGDRIHLTVMRDNLHLIKPRV